MDGRPSRLSLSSRKRRLRKQSLQRDGEKKLCQNQAHTIAPAPSPSPFMLENNDADHEQQPQSCGEISDVSKKENNKCAVIEILSSDEDEICKDRSLGVSSIGGAEISKISSSSPGDPSKLKVSCISTPPSSSSVSATASDSPPQSPSITPNIETGSSLEETKHGLKNSQQSPSCTEEMISTVGDGTTSCSTSSTSTSIGIGIGTGMPTKPPPPLPKATTKLSYKTSAYVQNLAETSYDILNDARWRISHKRIFQWELGDDLSVLHSFSRLFILPSDNTSNLNNTKEEEETRTESSAGKQGNEKIVSSHFHDPQEELDARCMHLYARLFHRKGPWFHIADIFIKYYHRDYIRRQNYESNNNHHKNKDGDEDRTELNGDSSDPETVSWDILERSLADCMLDLCRLIRMGAIRGFSSETECGEVVGSKDSKFLTEKEKQKVLHKLGGKSSKHKHGGNGNTNTATRCDTNDILKQMKSQRTMLFLKKGSLLPVRNHVNDTIFDAFAAKLNALISNDSSKEMCACAGRRQKSTQEIKNVIKRIWKLSSSTVCGCEGSTISLGNISISTCFRLREQPLLALRRACRLYLLAGDGPGSMRWSGSNAWISVIETKDNFSAQRKEEQRLTKGICTLPHPPNATLWNQVDHHGLNYRMGLNYFSYTENYERIPAENDRENDNAETKTTTVEIFRDQTTFKTWELCAELRCLIDYLLEWNRLVLYCDRKIQRGSKKNSDTSIDIKEYLEPCIPSEVFDALSVEGRKRLCDQFFRFCTEGELSGPRLQNSNIIHERVEEIMKSFQPTCSAANGDSHGSGSDSFLTDAERMICSMGIICSQALLYFLEILPSAAARSLVERPWLRHLQPESILAYIVWDAVECIEKRGYHAIACRILETIIFGHSVEVSNWTFEPFLQRMKDKSEIYHVSQVLLSRRVKGKALERLFIDKKHVMRKENSKKKNKATKKRKVPCVVDSFTAGCITSFASSASVPFSFLRKFSRRIKQPLFKSLGDALSSEMFELGIRLLNDANPAVKETGLMSGEKGHEWSPTLDISVANALRHESESGVGRRCAFIGDDDGTGLEHTRSLNVEELAIELYASGKLPVDKDDDVHNTLRGGWKGWHSEGVHVRILFRVLCASLLFGKGSLTNDDEERTIFLHPYQTAPLDLHVAYEIFQDADDSKSAETSRVIRSFYDRRRREIDRFFDKLAAMSPQEICDLVHESVSSKINAAKKIGKRFINDQALFKDVQQVRTLSMLAAGFGGQQLAAMLRMLCFDYRHWGAGLPDLLLVRAFVRVPDAHGVEQLDLCQWIGEVFQHSPTCNSAILDDRDEEFIGGQLNQRQTLISTNRKQNDNEWSIHNCNPEKLILSSDGHPITVDCMFVEVKSHNDRLDDRQEDWLNILDRFGNARLCKFKSSAKKKTE